MSIETHQVLESLAQHAAIVGPVDDGTLQVDRLASGTQNIAYRLRHTSEGAPKEYVLRTPSNPCGEAVSRYQREFTLRSGQLADFPYQPAVHYWAASPLPHIVEDLAHGQHPSHKGEEWSKAAVRALGQALGVLHDQTAQPRNPSEAGSEQVFAREYGANTLPALQRNAGSPAEAYLGNLHQQVLGRVARVGQDVPPQPDNALLHADSHPGNLLYNSETQTMCLLDWADSSHGDPAYDVAQASNPLPVPAIAPTMSVALSASQEESLLDAYAGANPRCGTPENVGRRVAVWKKVLEYCVLVNLAGMVYNPDAHAQWCFRPDIGWSLNVPEARTQLETHLAAAGLPVYQPSLN